MRAVVLLVLACVACGPPSGGDCEQDSDCAGSEVCARPHECSAPGDVRSVRITWIIHGQPATTVTCAQAQDLYVMFLGYDTTDSFGYEPVPCEAGLFTIDKLPTRYSAVEIGVITRYSPGQTMAIGAQGTVAFDLAP